MKLNKKVLIIFLVFIVLFLIFTNKGYCASGDLEKLKTSYSINDVVFDISPYIEKLSYYDDYDYHVIWYDSYNSQHQFWIVSTSVPNISFYSNNLCHIKPSDSKGRKRYTILTFKSTDGSFVRSATFDEQSADGSFPLNSTLYSSHDIVDSDGNVVFRQAGSGGSDDSGNSGSDTNITTNSTGSQGNNTNSTNSIGNTSSGSSDTEDNKDSWLDKIGDILYNVFAGFFEGITSPLKIIVEGISNLFSSIGNIFVKLVGIFDFLNPSDDNDKFIFRDLFNWFNPFSKDFFVYKLIELLGNLLKTLFIPENGWFENQVDSVKSLLDSKFHYSDYINDLEMIKGYASNYDKDSPIDASVNLSNYKVADGLTLNMPRFIDFSFLGKHRDTWFNWVRVFMYPTILLFNINSLSKLFLGHSISGNGNGNVKGGGDNDS